MHRCQTLGYPEHCVLLLAKFFPDPVIPSLMLSFKVLEHQESPAHLLITPNGRSGCFALDKMQMSTALPCSATCWRSLWICRRSRTHQDLSFGRRNAHELKKRWRKMDCAISHWAAFCRKANNWRN